MKYLKIEDNRGFYQLEPGTWKEIDKINKDDLMVLLDKAIETEFAMDDFEIEKVANKAHQIIYKNLYERFSELIDNKSRFKDGSGQLYKSAIEKYREALDKEK